MFQLGFESLKVGGLSFLDYVIVQNSERPLLTSSIFDLVDPIEKFSFALWFRGQLLSMFIIWGHEKFICL